ncbi:MAG: glycosyltransferase [Bacteroidota bacterium]
MKKVIVSVINDLVTDQRVNRVCCTLHEMGFDVTLVGRNLPDSKKLDARKYKTKRFHLLFNKGFLFYLNYNIRLFLYLKSHKADVLLANDADTLLANIFAAKLKRKSLIFDSHEYFTGVPELKGRYFVQKIWKAIERIGIKNAHLCYTVNQSIANLYKEEFKANFCIIRNVPLKLKSCEIVSREELGLENDTKIVFYQGAVNVDRGLEEVIDAMAYVKGNVKLIIAGIGDIYYDLQKYVRENELAEKVIFLGQLKFSELAKYTMLADIGLSIEKPTNINYIYSLPNKFFDYIQCNVPVLTSGMVEVKRIMDKYDIGVIIKSHDPKHIAENIDYMLSDKMQIKRWKENLHYAAEEFCWEKEKINFIELMQPYV